MIYSQNLFSGRDNNSNFDSYCYFYHPKIEILKDDSVAIACVEIFSINFLVYNHVYLYFFKSSKINFKKACKSQILFTESDFKGGE